MQRITGRVNAIFPGGMGGMGYQGQALNQLLVVMDGMGEPPVFKKFMVNRFNTFLDALFVLPQRIGKLQLRIPTPKPRREEIYFIGACNVPIEALDPALTRPGRMGRHIWFRTPTKDDRKDIFDLYMAKVDHEPDLDTDRRRDELARITAGYSPSMIEQCCSMALTIAHAEGRQVFAWRDIVEAMTTVESGTAQNIEYVEEETRAVAIHEAGHAAAGHIYLGNDVLSTRLSIRKRGGSLGHYQSMEKDERFSHFRAPVMGGLVMTLGAMAAEHVFYGENSQGVSGDLYSATATASAMVGMWGMGPEQIPIATASPSRRLGPGEQPDEQALVKVRLQEIGDQIMNRASVGSALMQRPDRQRALEPRQARGGRRAARAGLHHGLLADGHQPGRARADRRCADGAQGDARRRGRRAARPGRPGATRDRSAQRRDLADHMSTDNPHPSRAPAGRQSVRAADQPCRAGAAARELHLRTRQKFRVVLAALSGSLWRRSRSRSSSPRQQQRNARRGSRRTGRAGRRTAPGSAGRSEIAQHVAPYYRVSASQQLDVITPMPLSQTTAAGTTTGSGLTVALNTSSSSSKSQSLALLNGKTVAYNVCGLGAKRLRARRARRRSTACCCCAARRWSSRCTRSSTSAGSQNVVVVLPPGHPRSTHDRREREEA